MIEFQKVSKTFDRARGRQFLRSLLRPAGQRKREPFQALHEVSFEVKQGASLAVIGPNGAGKSTLLTLVAGIYQPDGGAVRVNGSVAALLELGSGFHPDLTGRENLFLNASLLGLGRDRTMGLYDSIVEFSGLEEAIHEPLRTYSTGMAMRLAFSVAVNVDPDILLTDEVFAVGDQQFQHKCIERIHDFRRAGKTLVCVSHDTSLLEKLCDQALWLDHGKTVQWGPAKDVIEAYRKSAG